MLGATGRPTTVAVHRPFESCEPVLKTSFQRSLQLANCGGALASGQSDTDGFCPLSRSRSIKSQLERRDVACYSSYAAPWAPAQLSPTNELLSSTTHPRGDAVACDAPASEGKPHLLRTCAVARCVVDIIFIITLYASMEYQI